MLWICDTLPSSSSLISLPFFAGEPMYFFLAKLGSIKVSFKDGLCKVSCFPQNCLQFLLKTGPKNTKERPSFVISAVLGRFYRQKWEDKN